MATSSLQSSLPCTSDYSASQSAAAVSAIDEVDLEDYDWETLL